MSSAHTCCKLLKKFKNTNKLLITSKTASVYFSRGCKSLMRGVVSEALASGKLVTGNGSSEGSQTAKSGTDEQKRHMRLRNEDKQAHHCNVHNTRSFHSRCCRHWRKEEAFTGGGLTNHELARVRSQQRPY
jgi:hypothetical protein